MGQIHDRGRTDAGGSRAGLTPEGGDRSYRSFRAWTVLLLTFAIGLAADLTTKAESLRAIAGPDLLLDRQQLIADDTFDPLRAFPARPLLPGNVVAMKLVLNSGAVFGIGSGRRSFFIVFTVIAIAGGLYLFARHTRRRHWQAQLALGLVLAGGIGNLHDRIAFGRVRDFLQLLPHRRLPRGWTWPGTSNPELLPWVFNLADIFLLAGMVVLMIYLNRPWRTCGDDDPS